MVGLRSELQGSQLASSWSSDWRSLTGRILSGDDFTGRCSVLEERRVVACHRRVQTPGGCWVHFSKVEIDGFRALAPGQEVDFEWQQPTGQVEGFTFVATQVRPVQAD